MGKKYSLVLEIFIRTNSDGRKDGWTEGRTDGRTDAQTDGAQLIILFGGLESVLHPFPTLWVALLLKTMHCGLLSKQFGNNLNWKLLWPVWLEYYCGFSSTILKMETLATQNLASLTTYVFILTKTQLKPLKSQPIIAVFYLYTT